MVSTTGDPSRGPGAAPFEARTAELGGTIALNGSIDEVFALFSPLGERLWVEGWDPEILAPRGVAWAEGMVFRTRTDGREDVWVVARLDRVAHVVRYYRTEPGRLVARVEVRCRAVDATHTDATIVYAYVGLSDAGNAEIGRWTEPVYAAKMQRWETMVNDHLRTGRPIAPPAR